MDPGAPWHQKAKDALVRFWRSEDSRVAAVRDVVVAGGVVLLLLGGIWIYTGQNFPTQAPLVVVESGSMMHGPEGPCLTAMRGCGGLGTPGFGRIGTIDPGDLVLVKDIDSFEDVETAFGAGGRHGYGGHGDVLVYEPPRDDPTPIIHRAMLLVLASPPGCQPGQGTNPCTFVVPETCDEKRFEQFVRPKAGASQWREYCRGSQELLTLDLERDGLFLPLTNFPCAGSAACDEPFESGFILKGDNNEREDVSAGIACCVARLDMIVGKARGEIPWFGLIKLAIYGNERYGCKNVNDCKDPTGGPQWSILRATAPRDIWLAFFLAVGVLVLVPIAYDRAMRYARGRGGREGGESDGTSPRN